MLHEFIGEILADMTQVSDVAPGPLVPFLTFHFLFIPFPLSKIATFHFLSFAKSAPSNSPILEGAR
jgi:hypothetical protein